MDIPTSPALTSSAWVRWIKIWPGVGRSVVGLAVCLLFSPNGTDALTLQVGDTLIVTDAATSTATEERIFRVIQLAEGQIAITTNSRIVNPSSSTGAGSPSIARGGNAFNPFPLAGASGPLTSANTSVFNPFPFSGAGAPLVSGQNGIGQPDVSPASTGSTTTGAGSTAIARGGNIFNPFPLAGASAPLISANTSVFDPFPFSGAGAPLVTGLRGIGAPDVSTPTTGSTVLLTPQVSTGSGGASLPSGSTVVIIQNPEPASWFLLATGLAGLAWAARRRSVETRVD